MKIYLDDLRDAPDSSWRVVRTPEDFKNVCERAISIESISFDHDLGTIMDTPIPGARQFDENGLDLAKWYIEQVKDDPCFGHNLVNIIVHTQNPQGAVNIINVLEKAKKDGILKKGVDIIREIHYLPDDWRERVK